MLLCTGFYFDIKPRIAELSAISQAEKQTRHDISYEKNLIENRSAIQSRWFFLRRKIYYSLRVDNKPNVAAELISTIFRVAEANGVIIQVIQPENWQVVEGINVLPIHVVAASQFTQFVQFIAMLTRYSLPIAIADYKIQAQPDQLIQVDMHLKGFFASTNQENFLPAAMWSRSINFPFIGLHHDPFSAMNQNTIELTNQRDDPDLWLLHSVSLQQLKLVGYVHEKQNFWALVMLPNAKTVEVTCGEKIGLENATILKLDEQEVLIDISGQKKKISYSL